MNGRLTRIIAGALLGLACTIAPASALAADDTTDPTISITSPADGQHIPYGTTINATYECSDAGGSGIAACSASTPLSLSAGMHTFTVNATDNAGNTATKSVIYTVDADTTPPTIAITSPVNNQHYALGAPINAAYGCDDPGGTGVATCTATPIDATVGTHTFTVNATDVAGNPATQSVSYTVDAGTANPGPDTTDPTITITSPVNNQHYALGAPINASYDCADVGGSGVVSCTATTSINTAPGTHTFTVNATDNAGNTATKSVTYTVDPDTTDPTIAITSPVNNQHYALGAPINAAYGCDDPGGSGIATCTATPVITTVGPHTFTVTATDDAGNDATKTVDYTVDPDSTAPAITITSPANGQHYPFGAPIDATYDCADPGGTGVTTCTATPVETAVGTHIFTVSAEDFAGNTATQSVTYTIDPDTTPPTIQITSPVDGQHYALGAAPGGAFNCDDQGTGVATCAATTPIVNAAGARTFTVAATDNAGNSAMRSVTYFIDGPAGGGGTPGGGTPSGDGTGSTALPATPRILVAASASRAALGRGVTVSLSRLKPRSRVTLQIRRGLRTIKTLRATANASGTVRFRIRLSQAQRRTLRGKTLMLRFSTTAANGKKKVVTKRLKVL